MRRLPWAWELLALPALGITRLLPEYGAGLWLRLAAATACVLLPGALLARALGRPGPSATVAWSLTALFAASAIMFAAHASLTLALVLYALVGVAALPFALRQPEARPGRGAWLVLLLGLGFGFALWHVAPALDGDALFHLARVRKLDAFGSLSLRTVDEFRDGGLHPGYAFPLWHMLLALVGKLAGVDPAAVFRHEASVLTPLTFLVVYEAGVAVFRSAWAGLATLLGEVAIVGLARGNGGLFTSLALPATAAQILLVNAVVALFFLHVTRPSRRTLATLAAGSLGLTVVHPTYGLFVAIPLCGYVGARALLARKEIGRGVAGLAAVLVPLAAFTLWLRPLVAETASHNPSVAERLRGLHQYAAYLDVSSLHSFRLAPEILARSGAVAVVALLAVPLAVLGSRRRWSALVLGGSLAILALMLAPELFTRFSDAVSLSQSRRAASFLPFAFAFAGGAIVLARFLRYGVLVVALVAGILLQELYPGDFGLGGQGGPALAVWIAAYGGAAALVLGTAWGRRGLGRTRASGHLAALAAAVFVVPVAIEGFSPWSPPAQAAPSLTPGVIAAVRANVPKGGILFSDDDTSYRLAAYAPIYVCSALPNHVASTKANRPYARRAEARKFFRTGDLAIPRRCGAGWILVDRRRAKLRLGLRRVYADSRFVLYRL